MIVLAHVDLSKYDNRHYDPGRPLFVRVLWYLTNYFIFATPFFPSSSLKASLLRLFGANVGKQVTIKPVVNIKYPWNLHLGDNSWIGEQVWIDCLVQVSIGRNVCISQGAYLCCGNHDWSSETFDLLTQEIRIEDGAWIGARAVVLPGSTIGSHAILTAGAVFADVAQDWQIYSGNPAVKTGERRLKRSED